MDEIYLLPSTASSIFLIAIAIYLFYIKPRKNYIIPLIFLCLSIFLWNMGTVISNLLEGDIFWSEISTVGLILIPSTIFHFSVEFTAFFKRKYFLFAYVPSLILLIILLAGYYVKSIEYLEIGYEPVFDDALFSVNSFLGLFFMIFSTFILYKYYIENVGVKRKQTFFILIAIPANSILSFISYAIVAEIFHVAHFPIGALFDFTTVSLIIYAILKFKLPLETASEIDFRVLAETAGEGICILDRKGDIEYSNTFFGSMIKQPNNRILGTSFLTYIIGSCKPQFEQFIVDVNSGKKISDKETTLISKEKLGITAELNMTPIKWNHEIIGSFITIRDVSARKKIENALRTQKTYFQALFDSAPEAVVSLDEKHRVLDVNSAFIELFGYEIGDIKGKALDEFILSHDEEEQGRDFTKKVTHGRIVKAEGARKRKDGKLIQVSILGAPIFISGKQIGIFGIYRDISKRKQAEEEREFFNSLLRHDIANKNTVVLGNLEMIDYEEVNDDDKPLLQDAIAASISSNELIEKIRNLNRITMEQETTALSIHEILTEVVENLRQQAKQNKISITYSPVRGIVKGNLLLKNIFTNLIQNAIFHSNGTKIVVSGEKVKRGDTQYIKINVIDDGEGISEELRPNIFAPRVKRPGSKGSGLGLYLVKKLIDNYDGFITIDSQKEAKGTTFNVYIPSIQ